MCYNEISDFSMDTTLKPNYQELIFNDEDYEDVFSESFFYSPETFDEEDLGYLFLVGKVKSKVEKRQGPVFLLNYIASKLSQSYYTYINYKIKDALSNSLEIVNRLIKDLYYKKEIDWLQDMFLLAGVIHMNKIYFAILNKGTIFLCRENKIQDLREREVPAEKNETYFFDKIFKADITSEDKILVVSHLEHPVTWKADYFSDPVSFRQDAVRLGNKSFAAMLVFFGKTPEPKTKLVIESRAPVVKKSPRLPHDITAGLAQVRTALSYIMRFFLRLKLIRIAPEVKLRVQVRRLTILATIAAILFIAGFAVFEVQKNQSIKRDLEKANGYLEAFYSFDYKDIAERRRFLNEARVIFEKYSYLPQTDAKLRQVQFLLKNLDLIQIFPKINIISLDKLMFVPTKMIGQGRTILLTDGANLGVVDLLREEDDVIGPLFSQKLDPRFIQLQKDKIYGLAPQSKKILTYDLKIKSVSEADIDVPTANIVAMQLYQDFVYVLSQDGSLYKYARSNLTKGETWFKTNPSFQNPLNFAIDGKIYVLDYAKIYRFLKGRLELENALNDNKIKNFWLNPEKFDVFVAWSDNYLYLIGKKDLTIQKLVTSSKLSNIQDVILDDNGTFYILQGKEVIMGFLE